MARVQGHQNQTGTCARCGGYDDADDTFVNNIENFCKMYDIDVEAFSDFHNVDEYEEICEDCFLEMKAEFESESFKESIQKIDNGLEQGIKEGYDNVAHKFFESEEWEKDSTPHVHFDFSTTVGWNDGSDVTVEDGYIEVTYPSGKRQEIDVDVANETLEIRDKSNAARKYSESTEEDEEIKEIREAQMKILEKAKKIGHALVDAAIKDMTKDLEGWDESTEESPAYILGVFMGKHRYAGKLYDGLAESMYDDYPC